MSQSGNGRSCPVSITSAQGPLKRGHREQVNTPCAWVTLYVHLCCCRCTELYISDDAGAAAFTRARAAREWSQVASGNSLSAQWARIDRSGSPRTTLAVSRWTQWVNQNQLLLPSYDLSCNRQLIFKPRTLIRTPDLCDSAHHFSEGTIFLSLCSSDLSHRSPEACLGMTILLVAPLWMLWALLCQEAVNQGSDDNSLAEGLASGTHWSIFHIDWRNRDFQYPLNCSRKLPVTKVVCQSPPSNYLLYVLRK